MDMAPLVPALAKLADYAASGIGSVAGTVLASWRARRQAEARRIVARGESDSLGILAEGQSNAIKIIAEAQAEARQMLVSPEAIVQGEIEFGETVNQRIRFQEEKRQRNIEAVVTKAALQLGNEEVQDHEPDHDWTSRFFNDIQDVSNEEAQQLYAKILAGEVERPGQTSIRTLSILRDLDQSTASCFKTLCSAAIYLTLAENIMLDARVPSLGGNAGSNSLRQYGLGFDQLNVLNEHRLIIADYNSWYDYNLSIGIHLPGPGPDSLRIPFVFQGRSWVLEPITPPWPGKEFRVSGVALTRAGQELSRIIELRPMEDYFQGLVNFLEKRHLRMVETSSNQLHHMGTG